MEMVDEESKNDVVKETRELLSTITAWPWVASGNGIHKGISAVATTHAADRLQRCTDASFIARAPELLTALCDEVEELRRRNSTQEESITHLQSQQRVMKEAIEAALPWLTMEIKERECGTHDQPTHCVDCQLRHKAQAIKDQLRAAITPRGSENK